MEAGAGGSGLRIARTGRGLAKGGETTASKRGPTRGRPMGAGCEGGCSSGVGDGQGREVPSTASDRPSQGWRATRNFASSRVMHEETKLAITFIKDSSDPRDTATLKFTRGDRRLDDGSTIAINLQDRDDKIPSVSSAGRPIERAYKQGSARMYDLPAFMPSIHWKLWSKEIGAALHDYSMRPSGLHVSQRNLGQRPQIRVRASSRRIRIGSCSCAIVATAGSSPSLM